MLKLLLSLILVLVLGVGGFYFYQNYIAAPSKTSSETVSSPSASPVASPVSSDPCEVLTKGSNDAPQLYSDIQWQQPTISEYEVPLGEQGAHTLRGCVIRSQNIDALKGRGTRIFYSGELIKFGWKPLVSADGIYSSIESYQKSDRYFVIQQKIAPDVVLPTPNPNVVIELFLSE